MSRKLLVNVIPMDQPIVLSHRLVLVERVRSSGKWFDAKLGPFRRTSTLTYCSEYAGGRDPRLQRVELHVVETSASTELQTDLKRR